MASETYSSTTRGAVRRIPTPHPHDVLSGRGASINAHPGNKFFRDLVGERKEDYKLARNKKEKVRIAREVMDKVRQQNPPGQFLQKDQSSYPGPILWVEVDQDRAMRKTSQALREGDPRFRLAKKEELIERTTHGTPIVAKRKRKQMIATAANSTIPAGSVALPPVSLTNNGPRTPLEQDVSLEQQEGKLDRQEARLERQEARKEVEFAMSQYEAVQTNLRSLREQVRELKNKNDNDSSTLSDLDDMKMDIAGLMKRKKELAIVLGFQ